MLNQRTDRDISTQVNALTNSAGSYTSSLATGFAPRFGVLSDLGYLNGRFKTGSIRHDVAVGSSGYAFNSYSDVTNPSAASVLLGSASISEPGHLRAAGRRHPAARQSLHLQRGPSAGLQRRRHRHARSSTGRSGSPLSQDWIWTDNYNNASVRTGGYRTNGVSPLESVMYKPAANMTVYGTYGSSLQQGDLAPGTAANPGEALPPYRSTQAEVGYKLAAAPGRASRRRCSGSIDRSRTPIRSTTSSRFPAIRSTTGVEATLSGRVASRLVLSGGLTVLDTNVTKTGNASHGQQAFRRHSRVQVEPADRVSAAGRDGHVPERQLAVRRPPSDRRHQLDLHAGVQRRRSRRALRPHRS